MFVARKSTPPTMSIAMFQGPGHGGLLFKIITESIP